MFITIELIITTPLLSIPYFIAIFSIDFTFHFLTQYYLCFILCRNMRQNKNQIQRGFTIVELLIVIVVIGILAAITIVAYNGVQNRAYDTSVQSDLNAMAKKISTESADTGIYPMPTAAMGIRITKSAYQTTQNNMYFCRNDATNQFALSARSRSGKQYKYTDATGVATHASTLYGVDTCQLVGVATWSGAYGSVGFDSAGPTWAPWTL
jgi:prepilin-type N-terminal cleavage/methylation domain-containing protein